MSLDIIIPALVPPGAKLPEGAQAQAPVCDRCKRETTDRNPILLDQRPSEDIREALKGHFRCDAICVECRHSLRDASRREGPLAVQYQSDFGRRYE